MRLILAVFSASFLSAASVSHADLQIDSIGGGYWIEESPYIEVYQETELGLHPQVFLGPEVFGVSVKTNSLYELYGIEMAPYFGLGGADSDPEGLLGLEFSRRFNVQNNRLDAYFRANIDLHDAEFMLGARYFFNYGDDQ
jgi:hypothetical protein